MSHSITLPHYTLSTRWFISDCENLWGNAGIVLKVSVLVSIFFSFFLFIIISSLVDMYTCVLCDFMILLDL